MVDLTAWTLSRDVFFINCSRRKFKRDGYLCVKQLDRDSQGDIYTTACIPSLKHHNDVDTFMLFRLLPSSILKQGLSASTNKTAVEDTDLMKLSMLDKEDGEEDDEAAERQRKEMARILSATVDVHTNESDEQHSLNLVPSD